MDQQQEKQQQHQQGTNHQHQPRGARRPFHRNGFYHHNHNLNNNTNNGHYHSHQDITSHAHNGRRREFHASQHQQRVVGGTGTGSNSGSDMNLRESMNSMMYNSSAKQALVNLRQMVRRLQDTASEKLKALRDVDARELDRQTQQAQKKQHEDVKKKEGRHEKNKESSKVGETGDVVQEETKAKEGATDGAESSWKATFERERSSVLGKFITRERRLETDIQRAVQDLERAYDRRVFSDQRMFDSEMMLRDQYNICQQRILQADDKIRQLAEEVDYYRQVTHTLTVAAQQREIDIVAEKQAAVLQARAEAMSHFIKFGSQVIFSDPLLQSGSKVCQHQLSIDSVHSSVPAVIQSIISESLDPGIMPMPSFIAPDEGVLSDLRDRYEDFKCSRYTDEQCQNTEQILDMIRKIVTFYEKYGCRVYEEALHDQYVSLLSWSPDGLFAPLRKNAGTPLVSGFGANQMAATTQAVKQAFALITDFEKQMEEHEKQPEDKAVPVPRTDSTDDDSAVPPSPTSTHEHCDDPESVFFGGSSKPEENQCLDDGFQTPIPIEDTHSVAEDESDVTSSSPSTPLSRCFKMEDIQSPEGSYATEDNSSFDCGSEA